MCRHCLRLAENVENKPFLHTIVPPTRGQLIEIKPFLVFVDIPTIAVDIPPFLRRVTVFVTPDNTPGLGIIGVSFGVSFGILAMEVRSKKWYKSLGR